MNATDQQLLQDYRTRGTDDAFAALVQHYVDLLYSTNRPAGTKPRANPAPAT